MFSICSKAGSGERQVEGQIRAPFHCGCHRHFLNVGKKCRAKPPGRSTDFMLVQCKPND
jgi:hypothetical protein